MKTGTLVVALVAAGLVGAAAGYWIATHRAAHVAAPATSGHAPATDRRVLYWYDPMHPESRFDKPGKSPFMDMALVPKYADEAVAGGGVSIDPRVVQNLGVRIAEARRGSLAPKLDAVGSVEYDERAVVVVQPRAGGFVEKLHARAPLDPVRAGDPLVDLFFPEWAAAQEEYLLARRIRAPESEALATAARQRLVLLGMSEDQIAAVEREGRPQSRFTLRAPVSGVIAELGAREGMTVTAGAMLFRIAGLGTVWVVAQVPEAQAGLLAPGAQAEVRVPAYPGEVFRGRVGAMLPEVNAATRTVRARVEVANPGGKLKPGMYTNLAFTAGSRDGLLVPNDAVIRTGQRSVVILAEGEGRFRAAEVEIGMESGGDIEIRKGLRAGDKVVVSGQFLIDSEAGLRSALARLSAPETPPEAAPGRPQALHRGSGTVNAVDAAHGRIEIAHGPIPALNWPAMTMEFAVADGKQLAAVKKGDAVEFELRAEPDRDGAYVIQRIARTK